MIKYDMVLKPLEAASTLAGKGNPIEVGVRFHDEMICFHEQLGFVPGTHKQHLLFTLLGEWNGHEIYEMRNSSSFSREESLPRPLGKPVDLPTFEVAAAGPSIPLRPSGTKTSDTDKRGPTVVVISDITSTVLKGDTGTLLELLPSKDPLATLANVDWHGISNEGNGNLVTVPAVQLAVPGLVQHYLTMSPSRHVKALNRLLLAFNAKTPEGKKALSKDIQDAKSDECARLYGYKLCPKHKQEYLQYCSCCAVETHEAVKDCVEEDLSCIDSAIRFMDQYCEDADGVAKAKESFDRIAKTFRARLNNGVPPYAAESVEPPNDLNDPEFHLGDRVDFFVKGEHGGGIHKAGIVSQPEAGYGGMVGVTFDGELDYSVVSTSELRHLSNVKKPVEPSTPEKDFAKEADYVLNHYSKRSRKDILCLARKLEDLAKNASPCSCKNFPKGLHDIHRSCETAALNGVPINLPKMKFCPWCGGSLQQGAKGTK